MQVEDLACVLDYRESPIDVSFFIYYCYYSRKTESLHSIPKSLNILDSESNFYSSELYEP